jgi:hypothetical protein
MMAGASAEPRVDGVDHQLIAFGSKAASTRCVHFMPLPWICRAMVKDHRRKRPRETQHHVA